MRGIPGWPGAQREANAYLLNQSRASFPIFHLPCSVLVTAVKIKVLIFCSNN